MARPSSREEQVPHALLHAFLLVVVLLTNHVHPAGSDRARINGLRRRFHDAVAEELR